MKIDIVEDFKKTWGNGVIAADLETVMSLYLDDAILKPTLSDKIRKGSDAIRPYFAGSQDNKDKGFLKNKINVVDFLDSETYELNGAYVDVGQYVFKTEAGKEILADYTYVLKEVEGGSVKIVSHHSSLTFTE